MLQRKIPVKNSGLVAAIGKKVDFLVFIFSVHNSIDNTMDLVVKAEFCGEERLERALDTRIEAVNFTTSQERFLFQTLSKTFFLRSPGLRNVPKNSLGNIALFWNNFYSGKPFWWPRIC